MILDCETDSLHHVTKIHVLSWTTDGENFHSTNDYNEMRGALESAKYLVCHNIYGFDLGVFKRILGFEPKVKVYDTLFISWALEPTRNEHGLESWGENFGVKKPVIKDWDNLPYETYKHRCEEDVKINWKLWKHLVKKGMELYNREELDRYFQYLSFKAKCAADQAETGWRLDVEKAQGYLNQLLALQEPKIEELKSVMPMVTKYKRRERPQTLYKKDGSPTKFLENWRTLCKEYGFDEDYLGPIEVSDKVIEPNPNSSEQVKAWLTSLGWQPCTFDYKKDKTTGKERRIPQVRKQGELTPSVEVLAEKNEHVKVLSDLTVIEHRIGVFKSLLKHQVDGWVKAEFAGLTNTLRFKHKEPVVNLPGVDKAWGKEIRSCLVAPDDDHFLCGSDMVSLEATTKAHYIYPYDPEYATLITQPDFDQHLDLAYHAGDLSQQQVEDHISGKENHSKTRKKYKTVNYGALYGIGKDKLARENGMSVDDAEKLLEAYWSRNWAVKKFVDSLKVKPTRDGTLWVFNPVSEFWYSLRFEKDKFSTINQSTGAYCFDTWVAFCKSKGIQLCGQFHDEQVNPVKKKDKEKHEEVLKWARDKLNSKLKLNVTLDIDIKFGDNYSDVH